MITDLPWTSTQRLVADVIVPARNNASTLVATLAAMPARVLRSVVVVDNASTDATAQVARDAGAIVIREPHVGYGSACLRGVAHLEVLPHPPDAVVFLPADGSADPQDIPMLLEPMRSQNAELVIGTRPQRGSGRSGAQTRTVLRLIGVLYGHRFEDLGPFRAIRFPALVAMGMTDRSSGWNAEMQLKSIRLGLHVAEVPVTCRPPRPRQAKTREIIDSVGTTGRVLFQILRNATAR
jgi:glycosyltransferase involved in cell wall biosynthesis